MRDVGRFVWPLMTGMSIIAGLLAPATWVNAQADPSKAEEEIKPLIVMISAQLPNEERFGAGIIFGAGNERLYILTANHVLRSGPEEAQKVRVRFKWLPGEEIPAKLLDNLDGPLDLGVLEVDLKASAMTNRRLSFDKLGEAGPLKRPDSVYSVGNLAGHSWLTSTRPDQVSSRDGDKILIQSTFIGPGHSGGALLNESRQLVGMITETDGVIATAVSIQRTLEVVRQWGYPVSLKPPEGDASLSPVTPGRSGPPSSSRGFHLITRYKVGGEGGWDYLSMDSASRRLYISRATRVTIINIDTGSLVGEIPNTNGVHGTALATGMGRGFTSDGRDGKVTIFDLNTLKVIGEVKAGQNPDAIIYDDATKRVFTFNGGSANATAIDAGTGRVLLTTSFLGRPESAAADGKGTVYVNIANRNEVLAIESDTGKIKARWSVAPGEGPSGMAMDREHRRLFIGCGNQQMIVMNADDGRVIAALPIGRGSDATAFDPGTQLAFSSNGDGTLSVVREESPNKFVVVENAATQLGARTMAVDMKTHNVILVAAEYAPTPAPTAAQPRPRPAMVPDSFTVLVYGR